MGVAVTTVQDKPTTTEYVPGSTAPTGWAYHPDVPIQMNPLVFLATETCCVLALAEKHLADAQ